MRESFIRFLIIFPRLFCLFIGLTLLNLNYGIKVIISLITFAQFKVNSEKLSIWTVLLNRIMSAQGPCFKIIFRVHLSKENFHSFLRTGMFVHGFRLTVLPRTFCVNNLAVFFTTVCS